MEDNKHSGRAPTCTTSEIISKRGEVINADRRQIIRDVREKFGLSYETFQRVLADELNKTRIAVKFISRLLDINQRDVQI